MFESRVNDAQHGSDHWPVVIEGIYSPEEHPNPKYKLNKGD